MIGSWVVPVEVWLGVLVGVLVVVLLEIELRRVEIGQKKQGQLLGFWMAEPLRKVVQQQVAGFWFEEQEQQQHLDVVENLDLCSGMGYPAGLEIHFPVWPCCEL